MLKPLNRKTSRATGGRFAIVAAKYNGRYVDAMLNAAQRELNRAGAKEVEVIRVPGSFEIPAVAAKLAQSHLPPLSAIICLGVIFQGDRKSTRLNSSHLVISYAVFCLKKKTSRPTWPVMPAG